MLRAVLLLLFFLHLTLSAIVYSQYDVDTAHSRHWKKRQLARRHAAFLRENSSPAQTLLDRLGQNSRVSPRPEAHEGAEARPGYGGAAGSPQALRDGHRATAATAAGPARWDAGLRAGRPAAAPAAPRAPHTQRPAGPRRAGHATSLRAKPASNATAARSCRRAAGRPRGPEEG